MDLLAAGAKYINDKRSSIDMGNITQYFLRLRDSLHDPSLWAGNSSDVAAWFKQSLATGFGYLNSTSFNTVKNNTSQFLSELPDFLRRLPLTSLHLWRSSDIG